MKLTLRKLFECVSAKSPELLDAEILICGSECHIVVQNGQAINFDNTLEPHYDEDDDVMPHIWLNPFMEEESNWTPITEKPVPRYDKFIGASRFGMIVDDNKRRSNAVYMDEDLDLITPPLHSQA
jgi:hypothetical protein